ncbi:Centriolar coiled-coil protein of 110 kDa [Triplophysa tibetana]|uniref:Centriolar coiled-coil protein of 110 kDa n=1 Tax=Triplophysa tibetana TaxID=1572043 RepID=A0A5A9PSW9_9TELE|nr:Centriolar coiled-coil protein of 110 kDa [Triplophysa tibetana]
MESYEEFCGRTLNTLMLSRACSTASQQQRAHATNMRFHGRRLLDPVLRKLQNESERAVTCPAELSPTLRPKTSPGSVLLQNQNLSSTSSLKKETLRLLNQRMEREKNSPERFTSPSDSVLSGLSLSLTGSYARLPSPQPSRSPLAHRARPSRVPAASNILISCPVSESELSPNTSECEGHPSEVPTPATHWNCSELSDRQLSIISSPPSSTSSQKRVQSRLSGSPLDEKVKPARRSPRAPLNCSYDVESPSPSLIRPQVEFTPSSRPDSCTLQLYGGFTRRPLEGRMNVKQNWTVETADEQETETLSECLEREHIRFSVEHMKGFCRLNAVARGFLTRRLLQTDKIKHLRKTVQVLYTHTHTNRNTHTLVYWYLLTQDVLQDSREFLRPFQSHSHLKRISISSQDLSLLQGVTAQLRAALHDIHQIFFVWPVKDKLHLLQQHREMHTIRETEGVWGSGVRRNLSSATQKTLERKKHRQPKTLKVMPKSSSASRSAVRQREERVEVRQLPVQRKCLSLR